MIKIKDFLRDNQEEKKENRIVTKWTKIEIVIPTGWRNSRILLPEEDSPPGEPEPRLLPVRVSALLFKSNYQTEEEILKNDFNSSLEQPKWVHQKPIFPRISSLWALTLPAIIVFLKTPTVRVRELKT